jgi:carboxyl-terminal processing protease
MTRDDIAAKIKGIEGTSVRVTVRRYDGSVKDFEILRSEVNTPTVRGYNRRQDGSWDYFLDRSAGIAYVHISQFNRETAHDVERALRTITSENAKGVIIDVRFNPGGGLDDAAKIADMFLDEGVIVSVKGRMRPESQFVASPGDTIVHVPVAVLVNEESASASEIFAGALQDHRRAVVVGMRTYGKGSVQENEDWKEDGALKITIAQYFLPSGRSVHRWKDSTTWGVDPSVEVKLDKDEIQQVAEALLGPSVIPPTSHATTRPTRAKDRQLDAAVDALAAMLMGAERAKSDEVKAAPKSE